MGQLLKVGLHRAGSIVLTKSNRHQYWLVPVQRLHPIVEARNIALLKQLGIVKGVEALGAETYGGLCYPECGL
jgi:hypothetical protein